jgi:hypothetical protein
MSRPVHSAAVRPATMFASRSEQVRRRAIRIAFTLLLAAALGGLFWLQESRLQRVSFTSGYVLMASVVFLISLHWRKQAPSLPLGKVSTWLQYHIYVAYLAIGLFAVHTSFRLPGGAFEIVLYGLFVLVAGSGVYGLYLTRTLPRLLRRLPEEVVFEEIPALRAALAREAEEVMLTSAADSQTLLAFYRSRLAGFFHGRRRLSYWLWPGSTLRRSLLAELAEMHRYLDDNHRAACHQLERLIARKDDLDYHAALQGWLKTWVFAHIALSYSLLALAAVHGVIAHAFLGGTR